MINSAYFRQQAAALKAQLGQQQSGGWIKRLFVWLILGVLMMFSLGILFFLLIFSWLLVPLLLFRNRRAMRYRSEQHNNAGPRSDSGTSHHVIEGEVISRSKDT